MIRKTDKELGAHWYAAEGLTTRLDILSLPFYSCHFLSALMRWYLFSSVRKG